MIPYKYTDTIEEKKNDIIIIQGTVGSGKTTLCNILSTREGIKMFPEPVRFNPFLNDFYEDPHKHAFTLQTFMLHSRYMQMLEAKDEEICIMDMSMWGNNIFTDVQYKQGYMTKSEYELYYQLSNNFIELAPKPALMVYLQCSTKTSVQRIMTRSRTSELNAPLQYWYQLNEAYEDWYTNYADSKKICINVDDVNIVTDEADEDYILDAIMEYL